MPIFRRPRVFSAFAVAIATAASTLPTAPAAGLIVIGASPSNPALDDALGAIGRWGNNAAAVAVAPGWVLTTRHQDSLSAPPNRTVVFGSQSYTALSGTPGGTIGFGGNVDLRLVRVVDGTNAPAPFASTLSVATAPVTAGAVVTLGGFGPTRGPLNVDGYDHAGSRNNLNGLLAGMNVLTGVGNINDPGGQYDAMAAFAARFDEPDANGEPISEATVAPGDSGGFWLVGDALTGYAIAGLSHAVESREGRDNNPDPLVEENPVSDAFFTQVLIAVDATPFASTINTIPEPASAALLLGSAGLLLGRRRRDA